MTEKRVLSRWQSVRLEILYAVIYAISLLPMSVLYVLSDGLYFITYRIIRYRRRVVRGNLEASFPDKSTAELRKIERDFYHWFTDIIVEAVKLASIGDEEMMRRMRFENPELPTSLAERGQSVILMFGHYCNWEWLSTMRLYVKPKCDFFPMQVYHPLEEPVFNHLFLRLRAKRGINNVAMNSTLRAMVRANSEHKPFIAGLNSDQVPHWKDIHLWTDFLSHPETPFFTGSERLAKKLNCAVVYLDYRRLRRGYYTCRYVLITDRPNDFPDYQITERYVSLLDDTIRQEPAFWLWSHKRWKRTREEYEERLKLYGHV